MSVHKYETFTIYYRSINKMYTLTSPLSFCRFIDISQLRETDYFVVWDNYIQDMLIYLSKYPFL